MIRDWPRSRGKQEAHTNIKGWWRFVSTATSRPAVLRKDLQTVFLYLLRVGVEWYGASSQELKFLPQLLDVH